VLPVAKPLDTTNAVPGPFPQLERAGLRWTRSRELQSGPADSSFRANWKSLRRMAGIRSFNLDLSE